MRLLSGVCVGGYLGGKSSLFVLWVYRIKGFSVNVFVNKTFDGHIFELDIPKLDAYSKQNS